MKTLLARYSRRFVCFVGMAISITAVAAPPGPDENNPDENNQEIRNVTAALHRHTPELMRLPEVVGTARALTAGGAPTILVFIKNATAAGQIPHSLDDIPVLVTVTGEFFPMKATAKKGGPPNPGNKVDTTTSFQWPVPIGVSTGNAGECSAGAIGARVKGDNGTIYALSNNHVYALENDAPLDSSIRQPGLYDTHCVVSSTTQIGTLAAFIPIQFSETASNTVDAALAVSSADRLGNATPSNGYGTPKSTLATAALGQAVQKYGRTTALTKGTVTGLDATVRITYSAGVATFDHQIIVTSGKPFIKPGDSGSLLVTSALNPVGLLFAGDSSGKYAIANSIAQVLQQLGARPEINQTLSIDGY